MLKMMTRWDFILIILIVVLSAAATFSIPWLLAGGDGEAEVVVTLRGEEIYRFPLVESGHEEIPFDFEVDGQQYTGVLEMEDGAVRLQRLPEEILPLGIHRDMGWISREYEVIVALPIQMTVTIETTEPEEHEDYDIIVQ
ncbi:NusG domain II-containing protein [Isachenkonia alkalipeptolytica]|uniref:NusG domain II-containing protein n=1 Tax=Isachenkonia alkalipeptolytica TaxID=2565777 RepID=A0AA43XL64_9CLOT|nr:NusG domain II-containing protein [Isachenkonia alkalipeptolytica]